jgi:L-ribulose-5-phosphate 3-epimerase UlaE
VGASPWEVKKILETANQEFFGAQYDIRHAVAEGGRSWSNGLKLLKNHIKTIVLKDFKWGKVNGKWQIVNVPIGEGMVDFNAYFKLLKSFGLKPPVCLHLEYPLGGADKGRYEITVDQKIVFDAMKNDLKTIQKLWKDA